MANYYLNNFRVSSTFGESRANGGHNAVDFAGKNGPGSAMGMNIPSIVGGKVIQVYKNNATAGNGVTIQGDDGRIYRYIHMKDVPTLKNGQRVKTGQSLGKIGSTGNSSGPHLDLRVTDRNGKFVDGLAILKTMSQATPSSKISTKGVKGSAKSASSGTSYKNLYKLKEAPKAKGYQTYKSNLIKAVQKGKVPESWAVALTELIGRESSWNSKAKNPKSSAYGYGQLIKANIQTYERKYAVDYDTPYGQIVITAAYIKDRYGTPEKALAFWDKNKWY